MVLTRTLYGEEAAKRPDLLPEQDKERIRTLSSAVAAVVGGVAGSRDGGGNAVDVLANAQVGGVVGQNIAANNHLAFHMDSDAKARSVLEDMIKRELGGKFELVRTGQGKDGYERIILQSVGKYTENDLTSSERIFFNMLNGVIQNKGAALMRLVYNSDTVIGGSWTTGELDVGDIETLNKRGINLSNVGYGKVVLAHEMYEQLTKFNMGLRPLDSGTPQQFKLAHNNAIDVHERKILPDSIRHIGDQAEIKGVTYSKIYFNSNNHEVIRINLGNFNSSNSKHIFNPTRTILNEARYSIVTRNNGVENTYIFIPKNDDKMYLENKVFSKNGK